MNEAPITLVVSDLHLGGGPADPGDDHVYQGQQLVRFLDSLAAGPDGAGGHIEIVINGDFLDFAQADQAAFQLGSNRFWCRESESLAKLETILAGHSDIFDALRHFQGCGNRVTIAAGNHDVDIAWPSVQARLRSAAGQTTRFEVGKEWIERYEGRLQIAHGHMQDPANRFQHWDAPILRNKAGEPCLEMCTGTLFMVKFVNGLEARYPFADNLVPIGRLFQVIAREDKAGLGAVAWLFMKFVGSSPIDVLEAQGGGADLGTRLRNRARDNETFRAAVSAALDKIGAVETLGRWRTDPLDAAVLQEAMLDLLGRVDLQEWKTLFGVAPNATLGQDDSGKTLNALVHGGLVDVKKRLREAARDRVDDTGAEVIVMGHTHQPDEADTGAARYFNPGSWTRYLELNRNQQVSLKDLEDESGYPYQLNYVRIERPSGSGSLQADKICFEKC